MGERQCSCDKCRLERLRKENERLRERALAAEAEVERWCSAYQDEVREVERLREQYAGLGVQVEAVLNAIDEVVPRRVLGLHPSLSYLHDMAQAMRAYLADDAERANDHAREVERDG